MRRILGLAALLALPSAADAQLPTAARWYELESANFRVTYEDGLEPLARHAAAAAERAHAALSTLIADAPGGRIDIVLADNVDLSNGFATPFPSNRIVLYAKPPIDVLELQYTRDWIELVVTHELAHIFHLDVTSGLGRAIRTIFGRVPLPWPVFPAIGTAGWNVEGLATAIESGVTGFGRVHGSYHEMVVRTAALAGTLDEYDRLGSDSPRWPGGARIYIYGSLFMDYLARRFGADAAARIVSATAGAVIPPPLWFDRVGRTALGITFRDAYRDWQQEVEARARESLAAVTREGLTEGTPLSAHAATALYPRFSPDGASIAYAASDWRSPPAVRVIDAQTGEERWRRRSNTTSPLAWLGNDDIVTGDVDFVTRFHLLGDLVVHGRNARRITRGERLQEPDARNGSIVAVQNAGGTNRLVLVADDGAVRPLTQFDAGVHWSAPRFSPDAMRVAASRWRTGGEYDLVIIDVARGTQDMVVSGGGVNAAPAWSPDGRWLLFWSDRSGIPNIYAVSISNAERQLRQVTNVITGAFQPDVSPDGSRIAYAAYTHGGFRIETMPFEPDVWRDPVPALDEAPRTLRDTYGQDAAPVLDDVDTAFHSADTTSGPARRYSPLRSLTPRFWLPHAYTGPTGEWYFGVWSFGRDLVGRHDWDAQLGVSPDEGRTRGRVSYGFNGLPELRALRLHPAIRLTLSREWDEYLPRTDAGGPFIDEREDVASITLDLVHQRWRSITGLSIADEIVRRSRRLYDAPELRLADPSDDLVGIRVDAFHARYVTPPFAISREGGYTMQLTARSRRDRSVREVEREDGTIAIFDGSYRELTTWNTAYLALPLPGFARHVLAFRGSGLLRDGPGAGSSSIGGVGSSAPDLAGIQLGSSLLLPVRGYARGARFGPRAWTASAEYRFPIAFIDAPLRPFFIDRLSGSLFADAGHAWCDTERAATLPPEFCPSTSPLDAPLTSIGGEATLRLSTFGLTLPLRAGAALPLTGQSRSPRAYITTGSSF